MDQRVTDIGTRLRQARETRGLTLRDIATTTKISMTALTSIERNDFSRLPGGVFRRAYVKAFAHEVGLDADGLAAEYRAAFEPEPDVDRSVGHQRRAPRGLRSASRLPAVLAVVGALGIWGASVFHRRAATDEVVQPAAGEVNAARPVRAESARASGKVGASTPLRLEIHATAPCWVSASADGDRAVYRLMQPGERALVEARDGITLRVGNAGAVVYSINGATGKPLGEEDEAVTVRITTDNFEELFAAAGGHADPGLP
jgi:cytoskeleton protein RodZ